MIEEYKFFLKNKGLDLITQKNYLSDVRYFLKWLRKSGLSGKSGASELFWFNQAILAAFKNSLVSSQTPLTTINRRLSGLRQFGEFLVSQGWLSQNPGRRIHNTKNNKQVCCWRNKTQWATILEQFKHALKNQKQSQATIKNYTSDVRQYLDWADTHV